MKENNKIKEVITFILAIVGGFWIIIQIFNYFNNKDYKAKSSASYNLYGTAPEYLRLQKDYAIFKNAIKILQKGKVPLKDYNLDSLVIKIKKSNDHEILNASKYEIEQLPEYKRLWSFTIENQGNKVIDSLKLELPLSGYYKANLQGQFYKDGKFENQISLGNLRPANKLILNCWVEDNYTINDFEEEKYFFTHNNGVFYLDFPFTWRKFLDKYAIWILFSPLLILIIIFIYSFLFKSKNKNSSTNDNSESESVEIKN